MTVAGLLLAAGGGRRYGMPKALVRHQGRLFVEHAAEVLRAGGCAPVVVVLGALAADVRSTASLSGSSLVDNPEWESGMGSSLRAGLAALAPSSCEAVVVLPVDTPGMTPSAVARLVSLASSSALARATYDGVPGHPVLIGRDRWAEVSELATGDAGARPYLARHDAVAVPCEDVASGADVDRPEDLPG
ncbi:nucleotidyltransferase family protein [Actinophytocola algeriensis]|uniref:Nicotine blue oxidoreductase n=1 Tax=Actinophytocola algeriensis TaxID=1768010 RepID=A0A7W7Q9J2_9PSEU|nr:nucleotidyltransferase family protein [Actinophytocola algeriensis]MBB4909116.1 nicotine blue oxidoreductase [Actinophytocola algeriensis]MBE1474496.1 nicotine blue oxidoreductase [Actinophytocola algeriensis]